LKKENQVAKDRSCLIRNKTRKKTPLDKQTRYSAKKEKPVGVTKVTRCTRQSIPKKDSDKKKHIAKPQKCKARRYKIYHEKETEDDDDFPSKRGKNEKGGGKTPERRDGKTH